MPRLRRWFLQLADCCDLLRPLCFGLLPVVKRTKFLLELSWWFIYGGHWGSTLRLLRFGSVRIGVGLVELRALRRWLVQWRGCQFLHSMRPRLLHAYERRPIMWCMRGW